MPKTVIEKISSPHSGVKVLKIGGTLGFHEKDTLTKILHECEKRDIAKLVIDFSTLTSLGGGCARILRDTANAGSISIGVAGASETTLQFFRKKGESCRIYFASTIDEAIAEMNNGTGGDKMQEKGGSDSSTAESPQRKNVESRTAEMPVDDKIRQSPQDAVDSPPTADNAGDLPDVICLGHDSGGLATDSTDPPDKLAADLEDPASLADTVETFQVDEVSKTKSSNGNRLAKKLFHYDALLSISSEFNRISDVGRLLDTFLLTTMAQVGVEHAAFLELHENVLVPVAARGIELEQCSHLKMTEREWAEFFRKDKLEVVEIAKTSINEEARARLESLGFIWAVPFLVHQELRGIVLLGRLIKKSLDEDSIEVMKILVHHAAIAYENRHRFEEASYRSLALIQTLISLVEEKNNLVGGSTFFIANYSYITAKNMHYTEENISDLMFGIVLRDIGMIKVSDLILKNPRELNNEEWEIIKQHPIDGAEMLKKMKFSNHAVEIVLHHHERFNGEGYPNNLRAAEIPLGARIVSVVESFGTMLQDRPTRPALSEEEALNVLKENWGMRYDPEVVQNFAEIIENEIRTGEKVQYTDNELFKNRGDLLCRKVFS
jgi:HD-GYP domain-containing protein (c-di-GMP phosphodiesterase class II)